ncbi:fimbria/pilus periplasmic chaperone [Salmonella enterica]|nr:fimbrial chaperone protein StdC [Salmonella enterica subsp. enterica serovar Oranienburg]EFQ5900690.1 fimbria/pilus periplasmic chaperone [Salmonella enterica]EGF6148773.1 fimbria/pilus periplasmic chaperone [Salmonella enterica]
MLKSRTVISAIVLSLTVVWSQGSLATINADRTRIIMNSSEKTIAVTLNNDDKNTPYLAQSWVTDADGGKTNALLALPPLQRIDGGQKGQVRITQVSAITARLAQDRETLFWFNVRGIPPKADGDNILQMAMQSRLKLFYRPQAIARSSGDQPERKLVVERRGETLALQNPTPYYITVVWMGEDRSHALNGFEQGVMVPPLGSLPLKARFPAAGRQLWVGYVDDYGGLQMNDYTCDTRLCALKDGGAES